MKVKELIKYLSDFNPDAEVMNWYSDGHTFPVTIYGWDIGGDCSDGPERNVENEKLRAVSLSITSSREDNSEK